jgi:hypothetical protein
LGANAKQCGEEGNYQPDGFSSDELRLLVDTGGDLDPLELAGLVFRWARNKHPSPCYHGAKFETESYPCKRDMVGFIIYLIRKLLNGYALLPDGEFSVVFASRSMYS